MILRTIYGDFTFRKVGQGSFFTGKLCLCPVLDNNYKNARNEFSFVYDCGSKSEPKFIKAEIHSFKDKLENATLRTLFLSHLDDDHVNYVRTLLDSITCEQVILPYLTPYERLIVALRSIDKYTINENDMLLFLIDPASFLFSFNVKEVVYILGNSESVELGSVNLEEGSLELVNGLDITGLEDISPGSIESEVEQFESKNSSVKFKKGNGRGIYKKAWEFYLFYQEAKSLKGIDSLLHKIYELYGIFLDEKKQLTKEQLEKILGDSKRLKELRRYWKDKFKDTNTTGLVLLHKPVNYLRADIYKKTENFLLSSSANFMYFFARQALSWEIGSSEIRGATLLTGDTCLSQLPYSNYIKKHQKGIYVLQIPHHGSKTGFIADKLSELNYRCFTTAVINFGWGNHYGHPSPVCINGLHHHEFDVQFCNQFEGFEYSLEVKYR